MEDDALLQQLAALFYVEKVDGTVTWPWMTGITLAEAGSPELEATLKAYRTRNNIQNTIA